VAKARDETIERVARALEVDQQVLSGERGAPAVQDDNEAAVSKLQLNVRVSTVARNGLNFAAERYGVEPSQIVELAPFLFCWAAETSLRQRLGPGVRRAKAALSSGCKSHPATAPAGSNRSSHGGNEVAEAFD